MAKKKLRRPTVYDAVAGRFSSDHFIKLYYKRNFLDNSSRIYSRLVKRKTRLLPIPAEEILFQNGSAPARYEENDLYFAPTKELDPNEEGGYYVDVDVDTDPDRPSDGPGSADDLPDSPARSKRQKVAGRHRQLSPSDSRRSNTPALADDESTEVDSGEDDDDDKANTSARPARPKKTKQPKRPKRKRWVPADAKGPRLPPSDLLRAIHSYAADVYGTDESISPAHLSSCLKGLDGTALIALGVLVEEMAREAVFGPDGNGDGDGPDGGSPGQPAEASS